MENEYLLKSVHDEFARRVDEENDRQNARLASLERSLQEISKITVQVERLATNIETLTASIKEQNGRLTDLEQKPAKRWDAIIGAVITGVVGILIGLVSAGVLK
ncbi:MAG: hypothetical protein IKF99_09525 [Oscillospiraceae bacterium]|nr:hypothetical protein [Oscillospiraceae bacterium]